MRPDGRKRTRQGAIQVTRGGERRRGWEPGAGKLARPDLRRGKRGDPPTYSARLGQMTIRGGMRNAKKAEAVMDIYRKRGPARWPETLNDLLESRMPGKGAPPADVAGQPSSMLSLLALHEPRDRIGRDESGFFVGEQRSDHDSICLDAWPGRLVGRGLACGEG